MKNHYYRPLRSAGGNQYKIRVAIIGSKVVLVIPAGFTSVVIIGSKALAPQCSLGSIAKVNSGGNMQEAIACTASVCQNSKLNPNINN